MKPKPALNNLNKLETRPKVTQKKPQAKQHHDSIQCHDLDPTELCFNLYSSCLPGACCAWKNRWKQWTKIAETMQSSMKTLEKEKNTSGKSKNAMKN